MGEQGMIYKCNVCGNIIDVLHAGKGKLVCCGQLMELLQAKRAEEGKEKHVPIIEKTKTGIKVKVGVIPHPMETSHYIEWIELIVEGKSYRQFLKPGSRPMAVFNVYGENPKARAYCNVHGLWISF